MPNLSKTTTKDDLSTKKVGDYSQDEYAYSSDYSYDYDYSEDKDIDCSIYLQNITKIREIENKTCLEFAEEGFRCVPYYACRAGEIITNAAG